MKFDWFYKEENKRPEMPTHSHRKVNFQLLCLPYQSAEMHKMCHARFETLQYIYLLDNVSG